MRRARGEEEKVSKGKSGIRSDLRTIPIPFINEKANFYDIIIYN